MSTAVVWSCAHVTPKTDNKRFEWLGNLIFDIKPDYTGEWPKEHIDHINGIKDDNRIENLREATVQQNQFNKKSWGKTSSHKGVSWGKQNKKWKVQYTHKSKLCHVGYYTTEEEAAEAYRKATEHLHKDYANYG